jgi:putative transcriptional regulator
MNLQHHFLLSIPKLVGPNTGDYFADALLYVYEHNTEGAMGLMVNRPSQMSLVELTSQFGLTLNKSLVNKPVFEGGPVSVEQGFVLHRDKANTEARTNDALNVTSSFEILKSIAHDNGPAQYMVALGYAGWGPGQLEQEVMNNFWLTVQADANIVFDLPAEQRLQHVAQQMGINLSLLAPPGHA